MHEPRLDVRVRNALLFSRRSVLLRLHRPVFRDGRAGRSRVRRDVYRVRSRLEPGRPVHAGIVECWLRRSVQRAYGVRRWRLLPRQRTLHVPGLITVLPDGGRRRARLQQRLCNVRAEPCGALRRAGDMDRLPHARKRHDAYLVRRCMLPELRTFLLSVTRLLLQRV